MRKVLNIAGRYPWFPVAAAVLLFAIYFLRYPYFVTQDGPAHVYNANLLLELLGDPDPVLAAYYELNPFPVPNQAGHYILAFLSLFLPAGAVEKVFLVLYLFGLVFSFRYLVMAFNPSPGIFTLVVLPFGFSLFIYSGFYNFCLAFIFLFWAVGYFTRYYDRMTLKHSLVLAAILALAYFSHLVITVFAVGLLYLLLFVFFVLEKENFRQKLIQFLLRSVLLGLISLPVLSLIFFYLQIQSEGAVYTYLETAELNRMLVHMTSLVGHGPGEYVFTHIYLVTISLLVVSVWWVRFRTRAGGRLVDRQDAILLAAVCALIFYYLLPDGDSKGGYFSVRMQYLFYLLVLAWIAIAKLPVRIRWVSLVAILAALVFQLEIRHGGQKAMSEWAVKIEAAGTYIIPGSVVLPVNCSSHWQASHLSNYLGAEKQLVILENYEAGHDYFPLRWKENPAILPTRSAHPDVICRDYLLHSDSRAGLPEYLFFYGFFEIPVPDSCFPGSAGSFYETVYSDDFCSVHRLRQQD